MGFLCDSWCKSTENKMLAATTVMVQPCPPPLVWCHSWETQFLILNRCVKAPYMPTKVLNT
eukprot:7324950-Karenia_brevis.AAC.1